MPPGQWAGSTRRSRLPANWPALVAETRRLAQGQCQWVEDDARCATPGTDCDHIIAGDDHRQSNLQWLCGPHHRQKTALEGVEARSQFPTKRGPEAHPGLISPTSRTAQRDSGNAQARR